MEFFEILEKYFNQVIAYPFTMFDLLFSPDDVFTPINSQEVTNPWITFVISFMAFVIAKRLHMRMSTGDKSKEIPLLPDKEYIASSALAALPILLIQTFVMSQLHSPGYETLSGIKIVEFLSYSVSMFLIIFSIVYFIFILFPIDKYSIMEIIDKSTREYNREHPTVCKKKPENAFTLALFIAACTYWFVIFNILQACMEIGVDDKSDSTLILVGKTTLLSVIAPITFFLINYTINKIIKNVDKITMEGNGTGSGNGTGISTFDKKGSTKRGHPLKVRSREKTPPRAKK